MNKWWFRHRELESRNTKRDLSIAILNHPEPDAIDCTPKRRLTRPEQHQVFVQTLEEARKKRSP